MVSLLTQCPHCHTSFKVNESQLAAADGFVRCGSCLQIFSAEKNKISTKNNIPQAGAKATKEKKTKIKGKTNKSDDILFTKILNRNEKQNTSAFGIPLSGNNAFIQPIKTTLEKSDDQHSTSNNDKTSKQNKTPIFSSILNPNSYRRTTPTITFNALKNKAGSYGDRLSPFNYQRKPLDIAIEAPDQKSASTSQMPIEEKVTAKLQSSDDNKQATVKKPPRQRKASRRAPPPPENKKELHQNLSDLNDEDSLDPIASEHMSGLDEEPLIMNSFVPTHSPLKKAGLVFANLLLVFILLAQVIFYNYDSLALSPRYKGSIAFLCDFVSCPPVIRHDLSKLATEQLVVRSHPSRANALQISFIFRNDANFEQPLPLAELNFSDLNNRLISNRVFTPNEYMPTELSHITHIGTNTSIQVTLDLVDPGSDAINYSLIYRLP